MQKHQTHTSHKTEKHTYSSSMYYFNSRSKVIFKKQIKTKSAKISSNKSRIQMKN